MSETESSDIESAESPKPEALAILHLRSSVVYPYMPQQLTASRAHSIRAVEAAQEDGDLIAIFAQRSAEEERPSGEELHDVGTVAKIHKVWRMPDGSMRLIVQGIDRARLGEIVYDEPFMRAKVEVLEDVEDGDSMAVQAMSRTVLHQFQAIVKMMPHLPDELQVMVVNIDHPGRLCDFVASNLDLQLVEHQHLLEALNVKERLQYLTELLAREIEILEVGNRIQTQVQEKLGKSQREYFLREQLRQIQKELSGSDPMMAEVDELRDRLDAANLPGEAMEAATRELDRMQQMQQSSPEYSVVRTYLDWLIQLPWSHGTEDHLDLAKAEQILDEDHFGLEKVKERVLEYLAVRALRSDMKGPILCFVGPPGVGKTSLGRSIARALGRKFARISLGGVRDESEIRGHRRTYVGALPGRLIQGLRKAGSNNPVLMLDEIDKLGLDFRGDPAAALLEVLDPQQNDTFVDHYLDVPFDLSQVVFITTANLLAPVPGPLRDRMEEISIPGYTPDEKVQIARRHLLPRQLTEHGIGDKHFRLDDDALEHVIADYTREAGLRNLERQLGSLSRKVARKFVEGRKRRVNVGRKQVEKLLGPAPFFHEVAGREPAVGVVTGLAATAVGGEILLIEATRMSGRKNLMLTGQLGDVMKESAHAALSYLRSQADALNISAKLIDESDVHLHVPAGATPKEGPSAGIALTAVLVSLFTNRVIEAQVALTGEITLRGRVLPVGGIRDKVLAAQRAGISTVVLPKQNGVDLEEVPATIRQRLNFVLVEHMDEVLSAVLGPKAKRPAARRARSKTSASTASRRSAARAKAAGRPRKAAR
ncbi:MAG: endopeptidase La [Candidatus Latescibacterota bacterium]|nr:endopeptidase La [Candidatus Latescibacterota bacterium]